MNYYYQNRSMILFKKREKYAQNKHKVRPYSRKKPLKQYQEPERKLYRKRRGYVEPVVHTYPKRRRRMRDVYSDGFVV